MQSANSLIKTLAAIDNKSYGAYRRIKGSYDFGDYVLNVDHVQGDPFAAPSRVRVAVPQKSAGFPDDTFRSKSREIALRDFLSRKFCAVCSDFSDKRRGSGKSGLISMDKPGQEILERTSVIVDKSRVEARFVMGLPAFGRRVAGRYAHTMFVEDLPEIIKRALHFVSLDRERLYEHVEVGEDADFLREELEGLGLVSFVADGAVLPRASGVDRCPLRKGRVVPFQSCESLRVEVRLPNRGKLAGMGVRKGVTLIVGGGYHGKSTLLNAIELGVYNHVPGDGREFVVTTDRAMKIRAEDGRHVGNVNLTPFISNLPFGQDTCSFSTEDASGSTSQAANILEPIEVGVTALLIDEDTSATNFMIRDHRMQDLVSKEKEPITPFVDKARQLIRDRGVSTILVAGGSGDYFDVADCVIMMVEYEPHEVTKKALAVANKFKNERRCEGGESFGEVTERIPVGESVDARRGKKRVKISCKSLHSIDFGRTGIDLSSLEQLVDISQTRAIGDAIYYGRKYMDGSRTLKEVIDLVLKDVAKRSLDVLSPELKGDYASFRGLELAGAINRMRPVLIRQK